MRKAFKRFIIASIMITMVLNLSLNVNAAPKTMPDGQTFDAEFYAKNNPDVVAALGTDEAALYNHYVSYGKTEGRKPYADAEVKGTGSGNDIRFYTTDEKLADGSTLQHAMQWEILTPGTIVTDTDILEVAKEWLPTGTPWGYDMYYDTISDVKGRNIAKRGEGCLAFAYWLTDAIYGTAPMTRYENTLDNLNALDGFEFNKYDIVCYNTSIGTFHCGVVLGGDPANKTLTLAEGNVNGAVDWNRVIKVDGSDGNFVARVYRR